VMRLGICVITTNDWKEIDRRGLGRGNTRE